MATTDGDILRSLATLRRRVRGLLALDGLARGVVVLIPVLIVFAALDWWVHFPWFIRALALALGGGWLVLWIWRRILTPLLAPLPLEQLALRIDALDAEKREGLASAVSFLEGHGAGSPELREHLVTEWRARASAGEWTRGLHPRRAFVAIVLATVTIAAVALIHRNVPELAVIGRSRLFAPWKPVEWPRRIEIEPLTENMVVAFGESVTVKMRIARGDDAFLRAYLEWGTPGGSRRRTAMQRDSDGVYAFALEDIRAPIEYAFVAGDDQTRDRPFTIRVARRPELAGAHAVIAPPPYAAGLPKITRTLGDEPLAVVRGSRIRIEATARRDGSNTGTVRRGELLFSDGDRVELVSTDPDSDMLAALFVARESGSFQIRLIDDSGLESRVGRAFELIAKEDESPSVEIVEPAGDVEMTARGVLDLHVRAVDDFGIADLKLIAGVEGAEPTPILDFLADERGASSDLEFTNGARGDAAVESGKNPEVLAPRVERFVTWPLRALNARLDRGMGVELAVDATDNFDLGGERHPPKRSAKRRIRIVSESDFAESLRQSLNATGVQLRRLLAELQAARAETGRLDDILAPQQPLTDPQKQQASRQAQDIQRLAESGRDAARRLRELSDRAEQNQAAKLDAKLQADRMERVLRSIADRALRDAAAALNRAAEVDDSGIQHESLAVAAAAQDQSIAEMRELLNGLDQWNEFADIARLLRQLLDRQEALTRSCSRLAIASDGRELDELTKTQRKPIEDAARTQSLLRDEATSLVRGMTNMAAALVGTDLISAGALEAAVKIAEEQALATKLAAAAADIQQNRLRRAKVSQSESATALRAMIAALEERPDRELAALSRDLADLLDAVKSLIRTQDAIAEETVALSTGEWRSEIAERLTDRQFTLARKTEGIAKRINVVDADGLAAQFAMLTAIAQMESASTAIGKGDVASAGAEQGDARVSLHEALDALEALQKRTDREMAERSMAGILEDLTTLRESQAAIRADTESLNAALPEKAPPKRADKIRLKTLADRQSALVDPLGVVSDKMTGSIVFLHLCEDLGTSIESAATSLTSFAPADAIRTQIEIMEDLDRMIRALESRPRKKGQNFVENESGGGGAGEPTMSKPVPPLAELKVLRMLQLDVNVRTRRMDLDLPEPPERTEADLAKILKLGEDQQAIHHMAEQMAGEGGVQ